MLDWTGNYYHQAKLSKGFDIEIKFICVDLYSTSQCLPSDSRHPDTTQEKLTFFLNLFINVLCECVIKYVTQWNPFELSLW